MPVVFKATGLGEITWGVGMATEDAQGLALKHCPVRDPDGEDLAKTLREGEGESEE